MQVSYTFNGIAATIDSDPICRDILCFLLCNESAMDDAKGIAAWWVQGEESAVQASLNRLFACGALSAHTLSSGTTLYKLTPDTELRAWMRSTLSIPGRPALTNGALPEHAA